MPHPFDGIKVLGALPPAEAAAKLKELGDDVTALALTDAGATTKVSFLGLGSLWPFSDKPWQHTAHAFGYVGAAPAGTGTIDIQPLGKVAADPALRNSRINVTVNRLRVADYPGSGDHRVLVDFAARNQLASGAEELHFNHTYRVREKERAAIVGYPVFTGLSVGADGLGLRCSTVNVKNDADEAILDFLEGDVFKGGLKLATVAQPAMAPLAGLAVGITKTLARRNRNVPVQDFYLGLDFSTDPLGARLALGSYVAVQVPETLKSTWKWSDWVYHADRGEIVNRADATLLIPYNYLVFGIRAYEGT